jgi:hypothetical protein
MERDVPLEWRGRSGSTVSRRTSFCVASFLPATNPAPEWGRSPVTRRTVGHAFPEGTRAGVVAAPR